MTKHTNSLGQPIGYPVENWQACDWPPHTAITGRYCTLEATQLAHAPQLFEAFVTQGHDRYWTYLPYGPFENLEQFQVWLSDTTQAKDPQFYTVFDANSKTAVGLASYLRITPNIGSIEVGHIHFSTLMQKTPIATETMFLMMQRAFEQLGYRRYEWKCDSLNAPSRKAALRLGFQHEGVFRQHTMYKGRSRDTAWFSILDSEWPALKEAFEAWLAPSNFDANGQQKQSLGALQTRS